MGKGNRKRAKNAAQKADFQLHANDLLTQNFQKEIRNSEFWPMMVAEFGEEKAKQLLRECKGELKPEISNDETGDCSANLLRSFSHH